ncbi:UDP-N-acetylmuramoyl-L-alanyl-D-glutamate--2,6-diaminopimelate ligase [Porticoccus sp. W117]|uniref:UDP-N-acetylmuramoyl-L-alanyl-D-glutamate--2, 6-diaminopimelate ligase n=1 Tax=Porticoccus sp. W117 TaxID=3054777 RepID=UPI00259141AE|nr:UDP-N-acetylmuramoyl-L-alanyl-D-glutamate--2,6-diaminopimelate ligase [Porticoccus sp. W117]MDM3871749.1 UDP-N-acetylmuramoyl-L-alanyl-D-glutamate--2,6-diaminopimelate ligase [Porticoccus sp. W117]
MMAQPHNPQVEQAKTLGQLLPGVALSAEQQVLSVSAITADSRQVVPGGLFVACPGLSVDGRQFAAQALAAGAVAVIAEVQGLSDELAAEPRVIAVNELAQQLSAIAGRFYGEPTGQLHLTGITGTNGKTTCSQLLAQLQQRLFAERGNDQQAGFIGTLGYGLVDGDLVETGMTTPDAIGTQQCLAQLKNNGAGSVVMEVSSHSLEQGRVAALPFHTAIFTNLSRDHLDYHGDMGSYLAAKAQLFKQSGLKLAVLNSDDTASATIAAQLSSEVACYHYGIDNPNADVTATDVVLTEQGICAKVSTPWGDGELRSPLLAHFNLSNLLAVITAACGQGWSLDQVLAQLPELTAVPGRMELVNPQVEADLLPAVVVDYAHTPDALEKALTSLRSHCSGLLWCVFGCGGDRDSGKRSQMGEVAARLADCPVVTSDNPRSENPDQIILDILAGMPDNAAVRVAPDRATAIGEAIACAADDDCVLIAGKGHETYQEVNGERLPFSDVVQAVDLLQQRALKQPVGDLAAHLGPVGLGGDDEH